MINVTVWNEFQHEKENDAVKKLYPDGIHMAIKRGLETDESLKVSTATLDEPEHGLTDDVLANTDVMLWWGHKAHARVEDAVVDKVQQRVLEGMGLLVLHSGHYSKIFRRLMGTNCSLLWREAAEKERLWNIAPSHPITQGIGQFIEIPNAEMYGERFDIPEPDQLLFISWFEGGEVFRSGATWNRGNGKIFYFRPGHETYPIYYHEEVLRVLRNGVHWAYSGGFYAPTKKAGNVPEPLETISPKDDDFGKAGIVQG
jgi:trehalose utilization protein